MAKAKSPLSPIFYVYVWFRKNGVPLYVGKAAYREDDKRQRWQDHIRFSHNKHFSYIIRKYRGKLPIVIVREGLTEAEAFEVEVALIAAIGRYDQDQGPLVNHTNGGDGCVGYKETEEQKEKRIRALRNAASKISITRKSNPANRENSIRVLQEALEDPLVRERQRTNRSAFFKSSKGKEHLIKMRANIDFDKLRSTMNTDEYRDGQRKDALEGWQDPTIRENHCIGMKNAWKEHPKIWITNGIVDTWHAIDQGEIPIGWRRGRTNDGSSKTL
jgi:hypothetical protein